MSIREVTYYQASCDWLGCTRTPHTEYTAWEDPGSARDDVEYAEWHFDRDGKRHYCNEHPATWASEHEDGEPFPEPPYLLIHDGDTDNSDDDGKVTLIGVPA